MNTRILHIFTRTPLHVGAGSSVGAVDQPVQRERHTGFPIIPGSSIKGVFSDCWNDEENLEKTDKDSSKRIMGSELAWLFGSDDPEAPAAGSLLFGEANLLAFPVRSLIHGFAWITCPHILTRAVRNKALSDKNNIPSLPAIEQNECLVPNESKVVTSDHVIIEEYALKAQQNDAISTIGSELAKISLDSAWHTIAERLVVVNDGMMAYFCQAACEVQQRIRIAPETGVVKEGALFNQENVPSDTLFYSLIHALAGRSSAFRNKEPDQAFEALEQKIKSCENTLQFGGDASIGLGFCTLQLSSTSNS